MPKGQYARKRKPAPRRTTPMEATAEAPNVAPDETPQPPDQSALILGLLEKISGQVTSLTARVEAVESTTPQFVPATPETYSADHERYQIAEMAPADAQPRSQKVPVTADGLRIPAAFVTEYPARFGSGSRVRLNLDAIPHGHEDGKTRGALMEAAKVPNAPGEVIDRTFLTKKRRPDGRAGVWKYRCKFPREVMPGAVMGTVSLHEDELIPA